MPLDPSIILGIKPPQIDSADERQRKALALEHAMGQQELQRMQIDQGRRTVADEEATRGAFRQGGSPDDIFNRLMAGGHHQAALTYKKFLEESQGRQATTRQHTATAGKAEWEVNRDKLAHGAALLAEAKDGPSFSQVLEIGISRGYWTLEAAQQMLQPGYSPDHVQRLRAGGMTEAQRLEAQNKQQTFEQGRANDPFRAGPGGVPVAQPEVQTFLTSKAHAGAPKTTIDARTGASLAGQVGPMMKDSVGEAATAVKQANAAQTLIKAIDSGKVIAGPGSNARQVISRIGQVLNVGGATEAERLTNTQTAIRSLAQLTLQARAQMRGQGAVSETEGALAERAASGDINLTTAELRALAVAAEKGAREMHAEHTRNLEVMRQNPELNKIEPFYRGRQLPPELPSAPTAPGAPVSDTRKKADIIIGGPR